MSQGAEERYRVTMETTVGEALAAISRITAEDSVPPRILIGGSLYLAGDVLADNGTPPT